MIQLNVSDIGKVTIERVIFDTFINLRIIAFDKNNNILTTVDLMSGEDKKITVIRKPHRDVKK